MVFESLVADLLNKYLGEYVDNLDRSQLKIGIWGGDVVLKDLSLKQSALDELQLPVKTVSGFLGKLILKIPWKNLYSEPVEATVEDLYLLVAPNTEVKYDPAKEEKWKQEAKQAEISKVEEAKKSERDKDKPKPNDTFTEKLATQIVRNVQLSIKNIHIRYEDRVHNLGKPFALGITLSNLLVTTTDENWKPCISKDLTSMIYKILEIEGLSVYWNSTNSVNFLNLPAESILQAFKDGIATKDRIVQCYHYLLGPITASSKLRLNTKPENNGNNFTQPKVLLDLNLQKLQIRISKSQYQDLMVLLDSMETMSRAAPYRKYRPVVPAYKGHFKQWWKFAYECILEEEVRRRHRNWSWLHILAHRHLCREYAISYREKLNGDPSQDVLNHCDSCESILDVLNIVLVRQKIEVEVKRRESEELLKQKKESGGWLSRWWGKAQKEEVSTRANIIKQFEEAMTPSEKAKLYQAIGYQENSAPAQYPVEFVAVDLNFYLQSLELEVTDELCKVLSGSIKSVCAKFEQRPAGQAFKVRLSLEQFSILGIQQGDRRPKLVQTTVDRSVASPTDFTVGPLLDITVEVNPLDKPYDQQVLVTSQPLNLVYDALTINKVVDVFSVEESAVISHIQSAATVTLSEFKAKSALGLQYALEKQSILDLRVNLMGFYGILAQGGHYTGKKQALVVINFGQLLINSKPRVKGEINVKQLHREGTSDDDITAMVLEQGFDRFDVQLRSVQVQMVLPGETWKIHKFEASEQCVLEPTNLEVYLAKSLLQDEPRNPRIKIDFLLPDIILKIAEKRCLSMIAVFMSIPFPESKEQDKPRLQYQRYGSRQSLNKVIEIARAAKSHEEAKKPPKVIKKKKIVPPPTEDDDDLDFGDEEAATDDEDDGKFTQFTDLIIEFKLREVSLSIFRKVEEHNKEKPLADFHMLALEASLVKKTYDFRVDLRLGGLRLNQDFEGNKIPVINTPKADGIAEYLFVVKYLKVSLDSPMFLNHTPIIQRLNVNFSRLDVLVHQEAVLDAIQWAGKVQDSFFLIMKDPKKSSRKNSRSSTPSPSRRIHIPHPPVPTRLLPVIYEEGATKKPPAGLGKDLDDDPVIDLLLCAAMDEISVTLRNSVCLVAAMDINGGLVRIETRRSCNILKATLKNFEFIDLNKNTKHPKVLSILGTEDALKMQLILFNKVVKNIEDVNMDVKVQIARFQVVFLNYFILTLLEFSNQFCAAQAVIKEASAVAAGVAKVNMQQAYKEAYRITLNIRLKAPIILVPANSSSLHALLMDFGVLNMTNCISEITSKLTPQDTNQKIPIIDKLNVGLKNFKVSRVMLKPTMDVETESLILQPSSFTVAITRSLCNDWFNEIPDLDISGTLESIHMVLSQEDYVQIMTVVLENLGECPAVPAKPSPVKTQPQLQSEVNIKAKTTKEKPKNKTADGKFTVEYIEEDVRTESSKVNVNFKFELTNLVIELLETRFDKMDGMKLDGAVCPLRSNHGLARFTLLSLAIRGFLLSDGALSSFVTLEDCLLDDTRASQYNFCRYMERKDDMRKNLDHMVDITFQQNNKTMAASIQISSFNLILNIEHLMRVADLFVSAQEQLSKSTRASTQQNKAKETVVKDLPVMDEPDPDRNVNITFTVSQPDIILVERMDPNTNAIIMNNEIDMKVRLAGPLLSIMATVKNLQVFSCCFDPKKRRDTKAEILRPVTINLVGSTPSGQGLHVELSTTNIRLSVTPGIIELLNSVLTSLTAHKQVNEEKEDLLKDYSNLWHVECFNPEDYWFLKTAEGQEATHLIVIREEALERDEICLVRVPSLVVTLEAGVGTKTLPMLLLESSLQAQARNWSSLVCLDGTATLQVSYYNSRLALWEPLVEPVEVAKPGGGAFYTPWELNMQIETNDPFNVDGNDSPELVVVEAEHFYKPNTVINITSKETMEVTLTKTCLEVLKTLAISFNNAIFKPESNVNSALAQYLVQNDLGIDVTLSLTEGDFMIFDPIGEQISFREVVLESGAKVNLNLAEEEDVRSLVGQTSTVNEKFLQFKFQVSGRLCELETPVTRADKRYFSLQVRGANNDIWGLVSDVEVLNGSTIITLRGIIQVHNHFHTPVRVYFMTKRGNEVESVGLLEPHRQLNLPLHSIYTPTNELFFSVEGYSVSNAPFVWKDLQQSLAITKILQCNAKNSESKDPYFIKVVGEMEQVYNELSNRHTMASSTYNIHLRPPVILKNFLPVDIIVCTQGIVGDSDVKSGRRIQIPTAEPGNTTLVIRISQYLNKDWSCKREIPANPPELSVWTFQYFEGAQNTRAVLDLGMHCINENGSLKFSLYCPFWMINKTGLMLSYRKSSKPENEDDDSNTGEQTNDSNVHYHPPHFKGPIMFSFRAKSFYGKKKSSIKVNKGEWSDKFSLDVAGSSGVVNCKANNIVYQIGVHIQLTYNTLTKQVTFTPYHILVNHCPVDMEVLEVNGPSNNWIKVAPDAVTSFWPQTKISQDKPAELIIRMSGSSETTVPFPYNRTLNCLLKLKNKYGAVNVDVQITEGAAYITFLPYDTGMAPALILNHSKYAVPMGEKDGSNSLILQAGEKILFNWSNTKENLVLTWGDKGASELKKDEIGEFTVHPNAKLFWVTFLDGMQRVLLFTSDLDIAREAEVAHQFQVSQLEIQASIHGFGISLVDNVAKQEILYLGITSSGVVWENRKVGSRKYKSIPPRDSIKIEEAYTRYKQELAVGNNPISKCAIGDNIVVDFATNEMIRPQLRELRRTYNQGLWGLYRSSLHQVQLHVKVNRLQMDNQTFDCVFPVVFAPVPPPKSVAIDNVMKPFAELSVVKIVNRHTIVQQFKYFKLLIQEFHVKVDIGFINALMKMFEESGTTDDIEEEVFAKDLTVVNESLVAHVTLLSSQEQKNFYDYLHFSPLKIHVSFSLSGGGVHTTQSLPPVLNVLMQSLGVTLTDIHDVVFKLSYFERKYTFLNQKQLMSEVQMHYRGQLIKQLYVLVLGLDVLGNPFGLVVGITEGVQDLFYEPFQGAIQGPGEFCEGLVLGVRSLLGHTVGGAAGAVSRITGAMGKGIAALTFDEDYQRKRRELMNMRPSSMSQGLAQSGKGLVMGIVEGVGGVFSKPFSGAKEEGVEGFIKGVGKGMVGLVTRPTAGVIDFASGSFNAVKRATELGEEVTRLRDPRYFKSDTLVRPYCKLESEGHRILKELEKGKYYTTDEYVYHTAIGNQKCCDILLLTDKRVLLLSHNDIFGGYQVEFTHTWGELITTPVVVAKGVEIKTGAGKKKLFRSNEHTRVIIMEGEALKNYVAEKMKSLMFPRSLGTISRQNTLTG